MKANHVLDIMIATHGTRGLQRVVDMSLPRMEGVRYVVSCQSAPMAIPEALERDDVEVHFSPTVGVSANRNNLLRLATAPWALVGDSDLIYRPYGLRLLVDRLREGTDADVITLRHDGPDNKIYPPTEHDLAKPYKGYYVTAFEIVLRMDAVRRTGLQFCEYISIGTPYFTCGEEQVLMTNARRLGLRRLFIPITVCTHPELTTGTRDACKPGVLHSQGMILLLDYPWTLLPRLLLKAVRSGGFLPVTFYHLTAGALRALLIRRKLLITQ